MDLRIGLETHTSTSQTAHQTHQTDAARTNTTKHTADSTRATEDRNFTNHSSTNRNSSHMRIIWKTPRKINTSITSAPMQRTYTQIQNKTQIISRNVKRCTKEHTPHTRTAQRHANIQQQAIAKHRRQHASKYKTLRQFMSSSKHHTNTQFESMSNMRVQTQEKRSNHNYLKPLISTHAIYNTATQKHNTYRTQLSNMISNRQMHTRAFNRHERTTNIISNATNNCLKNKHVHTTQHVPTTRMKCTHADNTCIHADNT
jgi:hypothetical protein